MTIKSVLLSSDMPDFELRGEDGRAIDTQQIFSGGGTDYTPLFRALIVQRHKRALSDDEFLQFLKAHVDHGFQLIKNDTAGFKFEDDYVDYSKELTRAGLEQRTQEAAPQIEVPEGFRRFD